VDAQFLFRRYLEKRFGSIGEFVRHAGVSAESFSGVWAPFAAADFEVFQSSKSSLAWEFTVRNYRSVWGFLAVNGRGIWNTVIFCSLAVLAALIFNPMAAYALSRFKPPLTYKLLLFLMLTMAFPPMVTQIPVFLMLRQFDLLNTFAALILPGLANGYSIFLLKGFFDSLPRELYESSEIDGASEWVIFSQITMSLSKPILAVIALGAFTGAYSAFMFALLLCQDQKMWTIMVWLYQLQQRSGEGVVFASLLIAAVPTLVVFLFAQKIIMRGIAVPVEK
jgi:ABC-type glycerol-3-phosphate transport system permease component